jgi:oligopeptide/dipeptide ABC transporter ATP-binding protein
MTSPNQPLLSVANLQTEFVLPQGVLRAVDGVSFTLEAGKTLGVVGESGSGKSVLARSLIGLLPAGIARTPGGRIDFNGRDLRQLDEREMRGVRGKEIAMIFQDPLTSLNPVLTIGRQIEQVLRQHTDLSARAARERAVELLAEVGIADPAQRAREYAHRLSGGMRQRVVIAIALACAPRLLIADEPTTALDVTVQAQILDLLRRLQERHAMAMVLITHNFGVVAQMCDDVAVMYAGRMVEQGSVSDVLRRPRMRYTHALLQSVPRADTEPHARLPAIPGQPPDLTSPPPGCRFAPRCAARGERCDTAIPPAMQAGGGHLYACWHPVQET